MNDIDLQVFFADPGDGLYSVLKPRIHGSLTGSGTLNDLPQERCGGIRFIRGRIFCVGFSLSSEELQCAVVFIFPKMKG